MCWNRLRRETLTVVRHSGTVRDRSLRLDGQAKGLMFFFSAFATSETVLHARTPAFLLLRATSSVPRRASEAQWEDKVGGTRHSEQVLRKLLVLLENSVIGLCFAHTVQHRCSSMSNGGCLRVVIVCGGVAVTVNRWKEKGMEGATGLSRLFTSTSPSRDNSSLEVRHRGYDSSLVRARYSFTGATVESELDLRLGLNARSQNIVVRIALTSYCKYSTPLGDRPLRQPPIAHFRAGHWSSRMPPPWSLLGVILELQPPLPPPLLPLETYKLVCALLHGFRPDYVLRTPH
jgi:hypothetical protein